MQAPGSATKRTSWSGRDWRHGRRHRKPALSWRPSASCGKEIGPERSSLFVHLTLVPFIALGRRDQDQADTAFGQGTARPRHPAGHAGVPLRRTRIGRGRAAQDRACSVISARAGGHRGSRRGPDLCRAAWPITSRAWTPEVLPPASRFPGIPRAGPCRAGDQMVERIRAQPEGERDASAIVGKYTEHQGLLQVAGRKRSPHGGMANNVQVERQTGWIRSSSTVGRTLIGRVWTNVHGILVPGGFGERGADRRQDWRRALRPGPARCPISAFASACRWR